jgi:hypothetical protein
MLLLSLDAAAEWHAHNKSSESLVYVDTETTQHPACTSFRVQNPCPWSNTAVTISGSAATWTEASRQHPLRSARTRMQPDWYCGCNHSAQTLTHDVPPPQRGHSHLADYQKIPLPVSMHGPPRCWCELASDSPAGTISAGKTSSTQGVLSLTQHTWTGQPQQLLAQ